MTRYARLSVIDALFLALIACGVFTALPMNATAQSVSGTLLGTVTDVSGAVVADAKITVVNEGTGLTAPSRPTETANTSSRRFRPGDIR